jgi:hypothetical protein
MRMVKWCPSSTVSKLSATNLIPSSHFIYLFIAHNGESMVLNHVLCFVVK